MPQLIQSFSFESFSLFFRKPAIYYDYDNYRLGNWNVWIQCTFTIQYCIIYIPWRTASWFKLRPEHSRPRPQTQGQRRTIPRPRNLALRPRPRINILCSDFFLCCSSSGWILAPILSYTVEHWQSNLTKIESVPIAMCCKKRDKLMRYRDTC